MRLDEKVEQLTSLSFLLCLLLELLQLLFVLSLNLQLHLGQLDLVVVFGLGDLVLQRRTVVLPLESLEVVDGVLSSDVIVRVHILRDLTQRNLTRLELQIGGLSQLIIARLHLLDGLIGDLLVFLLKI